MTYQKIRPCIPQILNLPLIAPASVKRPPRTHRLACHYSTFHFSDVSHFFFHLFFFHQWLEIAFLQFSLGLKSKHTGVFVPNPIYGQAEHKQ
jgi:hypothetical protein